MKTFSHNSRCQVDAYSFIAESHTSSPIIQMGNPISVNPCPFKSVKVVLENLKCTAGIPDHRQWSIVGFSLIASFRITLIFKIYSFNLDLDIYVQRYGILGVIKLAVVANHRVRFGQTLRLQIAKSTPSLLRC